MTLVRPASKIDENGEPLRYAGTLGFNPGQFYG